MFEINSPFTMVVFIVLIAVGAGVVNNWIKARGDRETDRETEAELDRMRGEVERLGERVRVLEAIATDKDERLRDEIRRLA
ncbi:MAG: hypothetical protein RIB03_09620 [Henriciella sp.]|uniref:hypothetical protein n=1 Tax=Henriciella sp. TaxID=1968823 RepID=UPI00260C8778|nr:hypothetical protein [Henriciella sp.]